jgi:hypothetical protein
LIVGDAAAPLREIRGDPRSEQDLDEWFEINENFLIKSFFTRKHESGILLLSFNKIISYITRAKK